VTAHLPERIPLDPPPGDPGAADDLVRQVNGAVFCLGVLETALNGPAGAAPGWRGDDATAAATRVAAVSALARDGSDALATAAARLAVHRDLLADVRSRIAALVAQQDDDHAAAWARLGALPDMVTAMRTDAAPAVAVIDEFAATEAARRREHAALLDDVVADARATARVLAECSAVVGGTGRPGDEGRVVAHLATVLPGWGEAELAGRGQQLASVLLRSATPDERDRLAAAALAYADDSAFARAFLAELGEEGVGLLLMTLASGQYDSDSPIAGVLAGALGGTVLTGAEHDPVRAVLEATYVGADDGYAGADAIAVGMAAVLAAGAALPTGGPQPDTVARWAGQLLRREHEQGVLAGAGELPASWDPALSDPAAVAIGLLVEAGRPEPVAALLSDTATWQTVLSRFWADGGTALGELITVAAQDAGPAGDEAVRTGLGAIGAGLFEGDPTDWQVGRRNVAAIAPELGRAVAAHVGVAVDALWVGVDDSRCLGASDALRGLGYLTVDRSAAGAVAGALYEWTRGELAGDVDDPAALSAAVAVPSAFVAAEEYGQRLSFALDTYEIAEAAEHRATGWNATVGLVPDLLPGVWGMAAGVVEGYAAIALGRDGTWENGVDDGLHLDAGTAIQESLAAVGAEVDVEAAEIARRARAAFDRTAGALGDPLPAESPTSDWLAPLLDSFLSEAQGRRRPGGGGVTPRGTG
jgi:hypothetical protein